MADITQADIDEARRELRRIAEEIKGHQNEIIRQREAALAAERRYLVLANQIRAMERSTWAS